MAQTQRLPSSLAFYIESTPGTGPANAAAWNTAMGSLTTGGRVRHIAESVDPSSFVQTMLEDMRSFDDSVMDHSQKVLGIKGGVDFSSDHYLHGLEVTTADATQAAATALSTVLAHVLGGSQRTNRTAISAGSSTTATVASTTNITLGSIVAIVDTSAGDGIAYPRRVTDITGSVLTFDEALPFTIASGDICHAAITLFFDEDELENPTTWSWLLSKGRTGSVANWEARGTASGLESIELGRNGLPIAKLKHLVASYATPEALSEVTWSDLTPDGAAPQHVGTRTTVWLQDYGTTTANGQHASEFKFSPGGTPVPIDTLTEVETGMPGRAGYSIDSDDSMIDLTVVPLANAHFTAHLAGTLKTVRLAKNAAPGLGWCVGFPRCEIAATPSHAAVGPVRGQKLSLRALRDTTTVATTQLWRSRAYIALF